MSSRGVCEECCVCGGPLQGNQRRWLFAGQNRRGGSRAPTPTPSESQRGGRSASSSLQNSPWSSSWSLGSSASLSRYQLALSSPAKGLDLLAVLSHILGRTVPRGGSRGEFLCGKCVAILERVFKFDSVIARVKVLSSERLQKLREQRDRMGSWVRYAYGRGPVGEGEGPGGGGEEDEDGEGPGYREMLQDNMSLSEYECWSERWDACPHFVRTGKRCGRGPGCEGCDSLRVSDSDYESVCGVPRHLPPHVTSSLALSRNKSNSMPLRWSSQASLGGSSLSSSPSSRTKSVQSLDSLDNGGGGGGGADPFDGPGGYVDLLLRELKNLEGKPVCSPSGSRIPLLDRGEGRPPDPKGAAVETYTVNRKLSFEENGQNGRDGQKKDKGTRDVPLDLADDFLPLHLQGAAGRLQQALSQLGGRLDEVLIETQSAQLGPPGDSEPPQNPGINGSEQVWLATLRSDCRAGWRVEREMEEMRRVGRERDGDLHTLSTVLQYNQDLINDLRLTLREKDGVQEEWEKEREVWRSREEALTALLQEKEALLLRQKVVLECSHREVLELTNSAIGQGMSGGGAEVALANQLREKEVLLAACLKDREDISTTLWKEINKMSAALQEHSEIHKKQRECRRVAIGGGEQKEEEPREVEEEERRREERRERRGLERELKEVQRSLAREKEEREREERRLNEALEMRDRLIEKILWDSAERDRLFRDVQQNLLNTSGSAVQYT
ncbi:uncharacterized protein si:ch73-95l15.5 isoform X1 [Gadus macrocephalus]|uniref:uncharacterized protein si:ch73-95l15.5 isoform X1 n=1 Tax=Gadus macrocephalus TaxID=80720 RepID=UPI0028CB7A38|nr:uncharacterized protein si:ch73-95l15.5 isoform X1 [Gadus macrocephalus]